MTVSSGKAYIGLEDPRPDLDWSIGGAITSGSVDVVPDDEFESDTYERNKWTGVSDYNATSSTSPAGAHSGVFIRVNDTVWGAYDQTRFGTIAFGGNVNEGHCSDEPCGALEFLGEPDGLCELVTFELDELPASNPTHLYRVQIHEREYFHMLNLTWELQWKAEVWDLSDTQLIGSSGWIWEYSVENVFGIEIPDLEDSKLAFGLGPGWDGDQTVERTGTSYWVY